MALRIEYFLFLALALLILSIMGINPISQEASVPMDDKELRFEDFVLAHIREDTIGEKISATQATKYKDHLEMFNLKLYDALGSNITAKRGIYKDDTIYMTQDVFYRNEKGFYFLTQNLKYDVRNKSIKTMTPFALDYNKSKLYGKQLQYNARNQEILADKIKARIYFTPK
jgi:LPS export ABC transporter protein LptC